LEEKIMTPSNSPGTRRCPYCAEEILADAIKCKHCGEWLDRSAAPAPAVEPAKPVYSKYQETGQLILLCVVSFFLYEIYWVYRNWKYVREYRGLDISPFWRTVGSLVPIVSLFVTFSLFTRLHDFGKDEGVETYKSPGLLIFFVAIFGAAYWTLFFFEKTTHQGGTLLLTRMFEICLNGISLIIPVTVQNSLNNIWKRKEPNLPIREGHTDGEIAVMIVGVIFWIFWLVFLIRDAVSIS
jgi:hypothetical protein